MNPTVLLQFVAFICFLVGIYENSLQFVAGGLACWVGASLANRA